MFMMNGQSADEGVCWKIKLYGPQKPFFCLFRNHPTVVLK